MSVRVYLEYQIPTDEVACPRWVVHCKKIRVRCRGELSLVVGILGKLQKSAAEEAPWTH